MTDPAAHDLARDSRALRRNNAKDSARAALQLHYGLSHDTAGRAAETVIDDLAGWLRDQEEHRAAELLAAFDPSDVPPVRRYPPEPTPEEWAGHALEPDDRPALEAHRDAIHARKGEA